LAPPALDDPALGLLKLVLAELQLERTDDCDGDDRNPGDRLGGRGERREVVVRDDAVEAEQLLA
jgi:hypothetical protein